MEIIPLDRTPKWVIKNNYPIELDKFYTDTHIAEKCLTDLKEILKKTGYSIQDYTFIEPSAGNGAFYDLLPKNKIGLDLEPEKSDIIKMNFFDYKPDENRKYIAIGNPPFGARAWMALSFIKQCSTFCDFVGFILPMYFASNGKGSAKNRVKSMNLILNIELPPNSFYKPNGDRVSINTVFQVWAKKGLVDAKYTLDIPKEKIKQIVDIYTVCTAPNRRCGLDKMDKYDYFLQSTYYKPPKVVRTFEEVKYGSGYGIIIREDVKEQVGKMLQDIDWDKYSLRATNHCKHLCMHSIYSGLYHKGVLDL